MRKLFEEMNAALEKGEDLVLSTVIGDSGSVPGGMGARMLVGPKGRICGTIGGGSVEYRSLGLAADVLEEKTSYSKEFTLRRNEVEDLGMICGGDVRVYFQYISAKDADMKALSAQAVAAHSLDTGTWLITDMTRESDWKMGLYTQGGPLPLGLSQGDIGVFLASAAFRKSLGGKSYYAEPLVQPGRVLIFGGGHVAQELVPVLSHLGFRCVIFEDREDFCRPELFPAASQIIRGSFEDVFSGVDISENDYVIVVTRGHAHDLIVQSQVLRKKTAYIGVIGSRSKTRAVNQKLVEMGIPESRLGDIHTPIGLDIMAKTPAEIAISIAAELILARARLAFG